MRFVSYLRRIKGRFRDRSENEASVASAEERPQLASALVRVDPLSIGVVYYYFFITFYRVPL